MIDKWLRCYPSNWAGKIVTHATHHPAKYSSKLIKRIYDHALEEGWIKTGSRVIDPFGGVALGAYDAIRLGMQWIGNELELKYHRIGQGMDCPGFNKEYWKRYKGRGDKWNELNICPSCGDVLNSSGDRSQFFGQNQIAIPERRAHRYNGNVDTWLNNAHRGSAILLHGDSKQITQLIDQSAEAIISSPPYGGIRFSGAGQQGARADMKRNGRAPDGSYGATEGQLGEMKDEGFDLALSSPPYDETDQNYKGGWARFHKNHTPLWRTDRQRQAEYGDTDGQLSGAQDFWIAARQIVDQVYSLTKAGGHAIWVVKDYVKGGRVIPFSDRWRQLCEAAGFETLHEHHAMLVHSHGKQISLEGEVIERTTESKSFFRRLAEKRGSPRIDYETVYCMIKPAPRVEKKKRARKKL